MNEPNAIYSPLISSDASSSTAKSLCSENSLSSFHTISAILKSSLSLGIFSVANLFIGSNYYTYLGCQIMFLIFSFLTSQKVVELHTHMNSMYAIQSETTIEHIIKFIYEGFTFSVKMALSLAYLKAIYEMILISLTTYSSHIPSSYISIMIISNCGIYVNLWYAVKRRYQRFFFDIFDW